ncbi:MAG: hypothetical protein FD147_135 [Chloroflexi bacterium]|nr:MAG: hypothetical protein FD147_135 [Chloroflexota bacterium]
MHNRKHSQIHIILFIANSFLFVSLLAACSSINEITFQETIENYPKAEIVFQVKLPASVPSDSKVIFEILDDVTGLYFNALQFDMVQQDNQNYFIRMPLVIGSEVKYRFLRKGALTDIEYNTQNKPVRFRVLKVTGPALLQDSIAGWFDQPYSGSIGRIRGQLIDQDNKAPVPNMLISAAGMQTISASDGTFILEGLPIWTHNLVILSLDGAYDSFQQGAVIADEATTPVFITLKKRQLVEINFIAKTPAGFESNLPLRFASNLTSLGSPYADLSSGSSTIASNLPILERVSKDQYLVKLNLPSGSDLKYKFTFGDGFWNSELDNSGNFVIRELIVPAKSTTIKKEIATFNSPNFGEVVINLSTPVITPANDFVSIQFNPFGWMEPLPMVKAGENNWTYTLYSPLHYFGNIDYRFCRNDQCAIALSQSNIENVIVGSNETQLITINLDKWDNLDVAKSATSVDTDGGSLQPRSSFIAGFELVNDFPPSWQTSVDQGLQAMAGTGGNWVILSPTWSATSINPPLFEPIPGSDLLWTDIQNLITRVTVANLQPVLFPRITFTDSSDKFWDYAIKDGGWWQSLFDRYQRFILHNADLAAIMNVDAIMVGDPAMSAAMIGGMLSNGDSVSAPVNADEQWSQLVQDIRARYQGPVVGVVSLPSSNNSFPAWLNNVDAIYVLFSPSLEESGESTVLNLKNTFGTQLDEIVLPLYNQFSKPILIGINYPSTNSSLSGCNATNDSCADFIATDSVKSQIDLELQSRIYNASVIESASRSWISGFISRGFNPIVVVQDKSSSIYGKPASDVLWFWYHFILNIAP